MPSTPKEKIYKVFKGHLIDGLGRDENAKDSDVGAGTVSGNTKELEELIGGESANYLRNHAVARRKAGLLPDDDNHGAELVQFARERGIPLETAKKLFKGVIDMSATPRLAATTPEQLVNAAAETINIAINAGVQIPEVSALEQQKVDHIKSLDIDIKVRNTSFDEAKLKQEKALRDAGMTLGTLAEYGEDKKLFGTSGMADRKKAAKIMERMNREYGWDYGRMAEDFSSNENLRQKYKRQLFMIDSNDKRLKDQATSDAYHRLVEDAPPDLKQKIVSRFNRLSMQEGMPPSMVWVKCLWDIHMCYHNLLSLPLLYNQMMTEYKNLDVKVTMKRAQMSFTDAQYEKRIGERRMELDRVVDDITRRRRELIGLNEDLETKKDHVATQGPEQPKLSTSDTICIQSGFTISRSGSINLQSGATYIGAESGSSAGPDTPPS